MSYAEKVLVPTLPPDDLVVMDNLGSHKRQAVRQSKHMLRKAAARKKTLSSTRSAPS